MISANRGRTVQFDWVKEHVGRPDNKRVDTLAKSARRGENDNL